MLLINSANNEPSTNDVLDWLFYVIKQNTVSKELVYWV